MHQHPPQAPRSPNKVSKSAHRSGARGKNETLLRFPAIRASAIPNAYKSGIMGAMSQPPGGLSLAQRQTTHYFTFSRPRFFKSSHMFLVEIPLRQTHRPTPPFDFAGKASLALGENGTLTFGNGHVAYIQDHAKRQHFGGTPMTEADYLDQMRFPLTTQPGLTLKEQRLIDAVNLDDLREVQELGKAMTEEQRLRALELEEKLRLWRQRPNQ
jgi:hypothetical protein